MSSKTRRLTLALGTWACILASCGTPPELAPQPPTETPPAEKTVADRAPAPIGEIAKPTAKAVIHVRPAPRRQPPRINRWKHIEPLYRRATSAAGNLQFARAEELFRELRDHEYTPRSMRRRFHEKVVQFAAIRYGLRQVQRELMRHDFVAAAETVEQLRRRFPGIPLRVFFPDTGPRTRTTTTMNPGR